jgi:hypothetical protein
MKKFTTILSLVAIVASVLFVSCAQKKEPTVVPAFPAKKIATYALNSKGVHAWSYTSAHAWSKGNYWTGFRVDPEDATRVMYYIAPNVSWSAHIVGEAQEFLQFRVHKEGEPVYDEASYYYTSTVSGPRGNQAMTLVVTRIPEFGEEQLSGELEIVMDGQTMPLATINVGPLGE